MKYEIDYNRRGKLTITLKGEKKELGDRVEFSSVKLRSNTSYGPAGMNGEWTTTEFTSSSSGGGNSHIPKDMEFAPVKRKEDTIDVTVKWANRNSLALKYKMVSEYKNKGGTELKFIYSMFILLIILSGFSDNQIKANAGSKMTDSSQSQKSFYLPDPSEVEELRDYSSLGEIRNMEISPSNDLLLLETEGANGKFELYLDFLELNKAPIILQDSGHLILIFCSPPWMREGY
jgi:hypothetical protein